LFDLRIGFVERFKCLIFSDELLVYEVGLWVNFGYWFHV